MRTAIKLPILILFLGLLSYSGSAQVTILADDDVVIDFDNTLDGVNLDTFQAQGVVDSLETARYTGRLDSRAWSFEGASDNPLLDFGDTDTTSADFTRGLSPGGVITGGIYAFEVESNNRALGWQATDEDFSPGKIRLKVKNQDDKVIDNLVLGFNLWNRNDGPAEVELAFSVVTPTGTRSLSTYQSPGAATGPDWEKTAFRDTLNGLFLQAGDSILLVWEIDTLVGGEVDEMALDSIWLQSNTSQLPRFKADSTLLITFDATVEGINEGTYNGTGLNPTPSAGQLDADAWQVLGASEGDTEYGVEYTSGDFARGTSGGGVTAGGLYAFDLGGGNAAFGWQAIDEDFTPGSFTLRFINVGGELINQLDLDYEVWVYNDENKSNSCSFSYSLDGINFTVLSALDLASEEAEDSSPAWEQFDRSTLLNDLRWVSGDTLYLRWSTDVVSGSGSSDELALNDIQIQSRAAGIPTIQTNSTLLITFDETVDEVNEEEYTGAGLNPTPSAGQLDADAWQVSGASDGDTEYGIENTSGDFARGASGGGVTAGGLYAFDLGGGNTAFGWQPSSDDFIEGSFTLRLINAGSERINQLEIDYDIWTYNDQDRASNCTFSYSLDSASFLSVPALDFESPGTKDVSPVWTETERSVTLSDLDLEPGDTIYLRWGTNDVSGNGERDELALDNISIAATPERRFYRTAGSGQWSDFATTWENSLTLDGDYEPATTFPTATNSETIRILERDSVALDISLSANGIRIDSLGYLVLDSTSRLTLTNEVSAIELDVKGTFQDNSRSPSGGVTFESGSTWFLRDYGVFIKSNNSALAPLRDNFVVGTSESPVPDFVGGPVTQEAMPDSARFVYRYVGNNLTFIAGDMVYPELRFQNTLAERYEPELLSEVFRGSQSAFVVEGDLVIEDNMLIALNISTPDPPLVKGNLIVGQNSVLTTDTTFVSQSDLVGSGIEVQGNVIVNGSIDFNDGNDDRSKLIFSSPTPRSHTFSGNPDTVIISKLVLNEPATEAIFLRTRMTLQDALVLSGAELYLDEGADLTLDTGLVFTRSADDLSIVLLSTGPGRVKKNLRLDSPEDIILGVGGDPQADRLTLTLTSLDESPPPVAKVLVELEGVVLENGIEGDVITSGIVSRTWRVINDRNAGTLDLEMEWDDRSELDGFVGNDFYISRYLAPLWVPQAFGDQGTEIEALNQSFEQGDTIILAVGSDGVLPIELLSFDARAIPEGVELFWRTASETENDFFSIERADDGLVFREIGRLPGAGTTLLNQEYLFVDENPLPGTNYYRLRQVDFNGQFSYSPLRSVVFSGSAPSFSALPNPASDRLMLRWDPPAGAGGLLRIFRMTGEQVYQTRLAEGSNHYEADLSRLSPGLYFVEIQGKRIKVLKQ